MSEAQFQKVIKSRARKHTGESIKYFWMSFVLQIILYAASSHLFIKHFGEMLIMIPSLVIIIAYIPFTVVLMKKFKAIAILKDASINTYVSRQHELLTSFYTFKKRYELMLIPLATAIGTFLTFELMVPGGVWRYPSAAVASFVMALGGCVVSIKLENEKSFDGPLSKLQMILNDLQS